MASAADKEKFNERLFKPHMHSYYGRVNLLALHSAGNVEIATVHTPDMGFKYRTCMWRHGQLSGDWPRDGLCEAMATHMKVMADAAD